MLLFIRQIIVWVPEIEKPIWRACLLKVAESVLMGVPYLCILLILNDLLQNNSSVKGAIILSGIMAICFIAQGFITYQYTQVIWPAANQLVCKLRIMLGEHIRQLPMSYFTEQNTGAINTLLVDDIAAIQSVLYNALGLFIVALTMTIFMPFVLLFVDWQLGLVTIALLLLSLPVLSWFNNAADRGTQIRSKQLGRLNVRLIEYVQNIEVIKAFSQADVQSGNLGEALKKYQKANIDLVISLIAPVTVFWVVLDLGVGLMILLSAEKLMTGAIALPVFLSFLILSFRVYEPIKQLVPAYGLLTIATPVMNKINALLDTPPLVQAQGQVRKFESTDVEFSKVSFSYDGSQTLRDISFRIAEKSMTAIVGPSGSGKTTIMQLIARFWDVHAGQIKVGGHDIREIDTEFLISNISMVFQDVYLFNDTIRQNIAFAAPDASLDRVIRAAKIAQCHESIMLLENGYDTYVGEGGANLSGGEKQRISIARAMLKNSPIILLDEATESVDAENERLIHKAINALKSDKTLVVVAHRLNTIQSADNIIVLNEQGQIDDVGSHQALLLSNGIYNKLWQSRLQATSWKIAR